MARTLGKLLQNSQPASNPAAPFDVHHGDETFYNLRRSLTPERARHILWKADAMGEVGLLYKLYDDMEVSDTRYGALIEQLKSTVSAMPLRIDESETRSNADKEIAEEYAEYAEEVVRQQDEKTLTKAFVDARIRGAKLFTLDWELMPLPYNRVMYVPNAVDQVNGIHLRENPHTEQREYGEMQVRRKGEGTYTNVSDLPFSNHLFIEDGKGKGEYSRLGVARKALPWYLGLRFVQSWWVQYIEKHGSPVRVGSYSRTAKQSEKMQMKKFLQQVGKNGYGLFPEGMSVKLLKADETGGVSTYKDFLEYGHREYAILILGEDVDSESDVNGIRFDIAKDVAHVAAKGWESLIKKGLRLNYGDDYRDDLCPKIQPVLLTSKEAREKVRAAQIAANMGVPVPENWIYERVLGTEKPKEGQYAVVHNQRFSFGEEDMPTAQEGHGENNTRQPEDFDPNDNPNPPSPDAEPPAQDENDSGEDSE